MKKAVSAIALLFTTVILVVLPCRAEENSTNFIGQLMTAACDTEAKETPDKDAETVFSYASGASIFVVGETDGWYEVVFQNQKGYVPKSDLTEDLALGEDTKNGQNHQAFVDALNEEMQAIEAENQMIVEEIERQRNEKKHSIVWGIAIAFLVAGIFVTGIISSMMAVKKDKDEQEAQETQSNMPKEDAQRKVKNPEILEVIDLDEENE